MTEAKRFLLGMRIEKSPNRMDVKKHGFQRIYEDEVETSETKYGKNRESKEQQISLFQQNS